MSQPKFASGTAALKVRQEFHFGRALAAAAAELENWRALAALPVIG